MTTAESTSQAASFDPRQITRPVPALMKYYLIVSLLTGPGFFLLILPLFFKYETLRYRFDEEGISMSWGLLWRREVYLTYRRIQDIHLTRNLLQRWLGLATVSVQTASGSATPEMSIEGILEADALRDYLYTKMRGAREPAALAAEPAAAGGAASDVPAPAAASAGAAPAADADQVLSLLCEIRDLLKQRLGQGVRA
jgi:putative membrane protein